MYNAQKAAFDFQASDLGHPFQENYCTDVLPKVAYEKSDKRRTFSPKSVI